MKIQTLTIQNFKAFGLPQRFDFEGKNVLVYGNNGSGKSSLYYALHVFFQSSIDGKDCQKYFIPNGPESLLNAYTDVTAYPPTIRLLSDSGQHYAFSNGPVPVTLPSSEGDIRLANLASDFMNYRLLFNFYNFRNSEDANVWDVFEKEIFPYWFIDEDENLTFETELARIRAKLTELSQRTERSAVTGALLPTGRRGPEYRALQQDIRVFNDRFASLFNVLKADIKPLLTTHFLKDEDIDINIEPAELQIKARQPFELEKPLLKLTVRVNGIDIAKPQSFLNEARLTALALSVRFAMLGRKFKGLKANPALKVMVIDDLLISLDMSNRMKVIKYLQESETLKDYQKIILTHDKGFYEILKTNFVNDSSDWKWFELYEQQSPLDSKGVYYNPICIEAVNSLTKAECYLKGTKPYPKDYEACALYLRKSTEEILRFFFDPTLEELTRYSVFKTLASTLSNVKKEVNQRLETGFKSILDNPRITPSKVRKIKDSIVDLPVAVEMTEEQTKEIRYLNTYRTDVFNYITAHYEQQKVLADSVKERASKLNEIRDRILNAGAHAGNEPLFVKELTESLAEIIAFKAALNKLKYP